MSLQDDMSGLAERIAALELDDAPTPARRPVSAPALTPDAAISATWGAAVAEVGGVAGAAIGGPAGAVAGYAAGAVIFGLYSLFQDPARQTKDALRQAADHIERAYKTLARILGGRRRRTPTDPPPTVAEATAIIIDSLEARLDAPTDPRALSPALLADLYGPSAATWNPALVYALWLRFYTQHIYHPEFSALTPPWRFTVALKRTGDFLAHAPAGTPIEAWPLFPNDAPAPAPPPPPTKTARAKQLLRRALDISFLTEEASK